jgi:hypothetical protein
MQTTISEAEIPAAFRHLEHIGISDNPIDVLDRRAPSANLQAKTGVTRLEDRACVAPEIFSNFSMACRGGDCAPTGAIRSD